MAFIGRLSRIVRVALILILATRFEDCETSVCVCVCVCVCFASSELGWCLRVSAYF